MALRRYSELPPSRGTVIPSEIRTTVRQRDRGCIGRLLGFPELCLGSLEIDHVRAGGTGIKSRTEPDNLVPPVRRPSPLERRSTAAKLDPLLLAYLARVNEEART